MNPAILQTIRTLIATNPPRSVADRKALADVLGGPVNDAPIASILTRSETGKVLKVCGHTIDRLAREGQLRRVKLPGRTRGCGFRREDVERLLEAEAGA
jgi:hypothetical protein